MIWRISSPFVGSCLGFSSSMVAGQIIEHPPTSFFDFSRCLVGIEHVRRQGDVVGRVGEEALVGHVVVVIAGDGVGGGKTVDQVVVVILFRIGVFVVVEGIAPLVGAPQGQVRFGIGLDDDAVIVGVDEGGLVGQ